MAKKVCSHHDGSPLFKFRSKTLLAGTIQTEEFEFCRYCAGSEMVTCGNCGTKIGVIDVKTETVVSADITVDFLKCNRCGEVIASADV